MNKTFSAVLFRAIGWAGVITFIALAVIQWRLDDTYHAVLALVLATVTLFTERTQRPTPTAALLLFIVLAFAVYRLLLGLALLLSKP